VTTNKARFEECDSILDKVGRERADERIGFLKAACRSFFTRFNLKENEDVLIHDSILRYVVVDYFSDIIRLKDFHGIDYVNQDKIVAYESSWFLRRKPLQVLASPNTELAFINENFITFYILSYLFEGLDTSKTEEIRGFSDTLFYHLKYRPIDARTLEFMITAFRAARAFH